VNHLRIIFAFVGSIALATLAGCGAANLAYNNAPMAVAYVVDDWVDLKSDQRAFLKSRVEVLLAWHRTTELPAYQQLLREAMARVAPAQPSGQPANQFISQAAASTTASPASSPNPAANKVQAPTVQDVARLYSESRQAIERVTEKAMPDIVAFMQTLKPEQISYLERKFTEDNAKLEQQMRAPLAERKRARVTRYVDRFEGWMGKLSPEQMALIQARVEPLPFSEELRLADRRRWQSELLAMLKSRPDAATIEREMRVLLLTPEVRRSAEYRARWSTQQDTVMSLTAELMALATPKQRESVRKRLDGYANDLAGLLKT
jgi:hypothetical protein